MFFVLNPVQKKRGFFSRLRNILRGRPHNITKIDMPQGFYYIIECSLCPGARELGALRRLTQSRGGTVLAPEGMRLPPGCGLLRADSRAFRTGLLTETALHVLSRRTDIHSAALIDIEGRQIHLAERLLQSIQAVYVVTADMARYAALNTQLGAELGAELILQPHAGCTEWVNAVIAPDGTERAGVPVCHPLIFAPDTFDALDVSPGDCPVPRIFKPFLPANIPADVFAAALYEMPVGIRRADFMPKTLSRLGRQIEIKDLIGT